MGESDDRRRWDDVPGTFEWRLLHLERENDDKEGRIRGLEGRLDVIETKLDALVTNTSQTKEIVDQMKNDRYKTLVGFIATGAIIMGTALAEHFIK